jgi:hypothetical protein
VPGSRHLALGTRQRLKLCLVPWPWHSTKPAPLPSAMVMALGKELTLGKACSQVLRNGYFAECHSHCTRQRHPLPSVTLGKVIKNSLFVFYIPSKQKEDIYNKHHQHHIYITNITYISPTPHIYHKFHMSHNISQVIQVLGN